MRYSIKSGIVVICALAAFAGVAAAQYGPGSNPLASGVLGPGTSNSDAGGSSGQIQINQSGSLAGVSEAVFPIPTYGALCNDSHDDSTAFLNAIAAASTGTAGTTLNIVKLPAGVICKVNSTLTLDLSKMAMDLNGSTIDMAGLSSSASALKLTATDAVVSTVTPNVHGWVKSGKIIGPGGTSIGLDTGNPTPTSFLDLSRITENLYLGNFGTGVKLGNGVFGVDFDSLTCGNCGLGFYGPSGVTNGGERIVVSNSTITNPTVGCVDYENADGAFYFENSSCDNQPAGGGAYQLKAVNARIVATDSHWEGFYNGAETPWQVSGSGGLIEIHGGHLSIHGTSPTNYLSNTVTGPWWGAIIENVFMGADSPGGLNPFQTGSGMTYVHGNAAYVSGQNLAQILLTANGPPILDRAGSVPVVTFSQLSSFAFSGAYSGPLICTDCTIASTCAGSGSGALAVQLNGTWACK